MNYQCKKYVLNLLSMLGFLAVGVAVVGTYVGAALIIDGVR
jgi:hypothetical protein